MKAPSPLSAAVVALVLLLVPNALQATQLPYNPNNPFQGCRFGDLEVFRYPGGLKNLCSIVQQYQEDAPGTIFALLAIFMTILVVLSGVGAIVFGGYLYMTAGGGGDRIKTAKIYIGSALLGITIALLAWIILFAISPNLV